MEQQRVLERFSGRLKLSIDELRSVMGDEADRKLQQMLALLWSLQDDVDHLLRSRSG